MLARNKQTCETEVHCRRYRQEPAGRQRRPEHGVQQGALVLVHGVGGRRGDEGVQVRAEAHHHAHVHDEQEEEEGEDQQPGGSNCCEAKSLFCNVGKNCVEVLQTALCYTNE